MYYIYALMDIRTNLPFYIGKGKKSNSRHLDHFKESIDKNSNRHKFFKINYLQKLGLGIPVIILVDNIKDEIDAYELEISYILKYGRENIDAGGILVNILLNSRIPPSAKGKKQSNTHIKRRVHSTAKTRLKNGPYSHTEELKEKLSNRNSGNGNPFFGKTHSKEFSKDQKQLMQGNQFNAKEYIFTSPDGKIFEVRGFSKFCRENQLVNSTMEKSVYKLIDPVGGKCAGWTARLKQGE